MSDDLQTVLSSFQRGDYVRTTRLCTRQLDIIESCSDPALELRLIRLLLIASELWWRDADTENFVPVRQVVSRAEQVAQHSGDLADRATTCYLRGLAVLTVDGLDHAIEMLTEAVGHARHAGDRFTELAALTKLGHISVGRNLTRGLTVLQHAETLMEQPIDRLRHPEEKHLLGMIRTQLRGYIGVAKFDLGEFTVSEAYLRESLECSTTPASGAMTSNYLGQLLTATGRFEEAEQVLRAILMPLADDPRASSHQGYNLVQLGKLYLEWGRPDAAAKPMLDGFRQVSEAGNLSVLPLARNFLAELLMHQSYAGRDLPRAAALFDETVAECIRTGFQRSEIAGLALGARVALARDDVNTALTSSEAAVRRLAETGTMPALRTEEVYFSRYEVLMAARRSDEARHWLGLARREVDHKAATITSKDRRATFLDRVPLNRAILAA